MPPNETATAEPPKTLPLAARITGDPLQRSLIARLAAKFHVDADKMMGTLKVTAFRQRANDPEPTNEQMMALLIVADQYGLNPWTKEIYAFPDKGGIVPVVGIDGWSRIVNQHDQFDGVEFVFGPPVEKRKGAPEWVECIMYRKDRAHPTKVREYLAECWRDTGPWNSHPSRMLRHKAFVQCARIAFGFVGIYDEDEAQRILEGEATRVGDALPSAVDMLNAKIRPAQQPVDPASSGAAPASPGTAIDAEIVGTGSEPASATAPTPEPLKPTAKSGKAKGPLFTVDELREKIARARDSEALALARDLIGSIDAEAARADLIGAADRRAAELTTTEG